MNDRPAPSRRNFLKSAAVGAAVVGVAAATPAALSGISGDPAADNTDVYAFVSPDDPDFVTLIANFVPLEDPAGGPNFFELDDDVLPGGVENGDRRGTPGNPTDACIGWLLRGDALVEQAERGTFDQLAQACGGRRDGLGDPTLAFLLRLGCLDGLHMPVSLAVRQGSGRLLVEGADKSVGERDSRGSVSTSRATALSLRAAAGHRMAAVVGGLAIGGQRVLGANRRSDSARIWANEA